MTLDGNGTSQYYKLIVLGFAGAETAGGTLSTYAVDNQSAFSVTSQSTVK
jgi:hypothetical protein